MIRAEIELEYFLLKRKRIALFSVVDTLLVRCLSNGLIDSACQLPWRMLVRLSKALSLTFR